jgi:hypothetical protein
MTWVLRRAPKGCSEPSARARPHAAADVGANGRDPFRRASGTSGVGRRTRVSAGAGVRIQVRSLGRIRRGRRRGLVRSRGRRPRRPRGGARACVGVRPFSIRASTGTAARRAVLDSLEQWHRDRHLIRERRVLRVFERHDEQVGAYENAWGAETRSRCKSRVRERSAPGRHTRPNREQERKDRAIRRSPSRFFGVIRRHPG